MNLVRYAFKSFARVPRTMAVSARKYSTTYSSRIRCDPIVVPTPTKMQNTEGTQYSLESKPAIPIIDGLEYYRNYITEDEQMNLIRMIDSKEWSRAISRRTQYYGYYYYHTTHHVAELQPMEQINGNLYSLHDFDHLIDRMMSDGIFPRENPPTQVLVNEYVKQQKISCHVDSTDAFGDIVVSLSLLQPCIMKMVQVSDRSKEVRFVLEPRSILVLKDDARFHWKHGIPGIKYLHFSHPDGGVIKVVRDESYRRVSLTFRRIKENGTKKVYEGMPDPLSWKT